MKKLFLILITLSNYLIAQQTGTLINPAAINGYTTNGKVLMTKTSGSITGVPTWTNTIPYSMLTSTPTIPSTVGLLPNTTSLTINGVTQSFTSTPTFTTTLQDVINQSDVVDGEVMKSLDGLSSVNLTNGSCAIGVSDGVNTSGINMTPTDIVLTGSSIQSNGQPVVTTTGTQTLTNKTITSPTFSTSTTYSYATALRVPMFDSNKKLVSSSTTNTQLSYLDATSSIQTQLNSKDVTSTSTNTLTNKTVSSGTLIGVTTQSTTNFNGAFNATYTTVASSSTVDLSTINANFISVTGTHTINSFGTVQAGAQRTILFNGSLTVSSSTNIVLPGSTSIQTAANDIMVIVSDSGGIWRCVSYTSASGTIGTWSPSWTGFSSNPTVSVAEYSLIGDVCTVWLYAGAGTSNATTKTVTLPFAAKYANIRSIESITNSGTNAAGLVQTTANSNILTCYATAAGGAWTASGSATVFLGGFTYRIAQ